MENKEYVLDFIIETKGDITHIVRYTWNEEGDYILSPSHTLCSLPVEKEKEEEWQELEEDFICSENYESLLPFEEDLVKGLLKFLSNPDPNKKIDPVLLEEIMGIEQTLATNAIILRFEDNFAICKECMANLMERGSQKIIKLVAGQK